MHDLIDQAFAFVLVLSMPFVIVFLLMFHGILWILTKELFWYTVSYVGGLLTEFSAYLLSLF